MEEWKAIKGFEGIYEVSNFGRVKRVKKYGHDGSHILKPSPVKDGYLMVDLRNKKIRKMAQVHRLVLSAFVGDSELECNHKDYDRKNNKLENLEYSTREENVAKGERCKQSVFKEEDVLRIRSLAGMFTICDIAKAYNVNRTAIEQIIKRVSWKHI
jgi:hypothetical protein